MHAFFSLSPHIVQEDEGQTITSNSNSDGPVITTSSQQTVPATNVQTDKIVPNKSLLDWLRQQSDYTLEIPGFGTVSASFVLQCWTVLFGIRSYLLFFFPLSEFFRKA